jgi:tetratricopeptide (TPR) repeat protein
VNLDKDALAKADEALMKAYELDKNDPKKPGKLAKKIGKMMSIPDVAQFSLRRAYLLAGQKHFETEDYKGAMTAFARAAELSENELVNYTDTSSYFNAGVAAANALDFNAAVKFYKRSIELKYGEEKTYSYLAKAMSQTADSLKVPALIEEGIKAYPQQNQALMEELIDYYLKTNKTDEAISYLDKVIAKNPTNHIYYYVKGTLFDKQKKVEQAVELYKKTIELKPDYYAAYYNVGVLYYNRGRDFYLEANNVPPSGADNQKKYDTLIKKAETELNLAKPYFEKALELEKDDVPTLQALREVYYKLKIMDKYAEVKAKLDAKP